MMNNELRPYDEYKAINLPWLEKIPCNWKLQRGKQIFKVVDERTSTGDEELLSVSANYGVVKRKNANVTMFKAESYVGYKLCWEKDLVVNSLWAWQQGLGFSKYHGIISTAYSVYRLRSENENYKYFDYLLRSNSYLWELRTRSKGIWKSRYQLHDSSFMDMPFIIPPRPEQDQIVKYLDFQLVKINKFIKAKKKLIAVLKEKKQIIINDAVTKGVVPNIKMKPSGIEWVGDVPEHWETIRIKWLFTEKDERKADKDLELLTFSRKKGLILYTEYSEKQPSAQDLSEYKVVRPGDLLMNKMQAWSGMFTDVCTTGVVSPDYSVFKPTNIAYVGFYSLIFRTERHVQQFALASKGIGSGFNRLYTPSFGSIYTVLPPFNEQMAIVENINKKTLGINNSISVIEKEIELISEYKGSLIANVITGKVDVLKIMIEDIGGIEQEDPDLNEDSIEEETLEAEDGDE